MKRCEAIRVFLLACLCVLGLGACAHSRDQQALAVGKANFAMHHYPSALKRLLPLAEHGNKEAQYAVGYLYYYGYGVARNEQVAFMWMKKAAAQDQPEAKQALAMIDRAKQSPFYLPAKG